MNFDFTDEQKLFADAVRKFAVANLEEASLARAHDPRFPFDVAALMAGRACSASRCPRPTAGRAAR